MINDKFNIYGFADDHAIRAEFKQVNANESDIRNEIENQMQIIKKWMDANRLKMNSSKTEFITLGSYQRLKNIATSNLDVNGERVERSGVVKYLALADLGGGARRAPPPLRVQILSF